MALNDLQIKQLDEASARKAAGQATFTDQKNIRNAERQGYVANPITSKSLATPTPIQTVPIPPDTTNYGGIIGGVSQTLNDEFARLDKQLNDARLVQSQGAQSEIDAMTSLLGKTADTQVINEQAGVNTATTDLNKAVEQLAGLNAQSQSLLRESQAIPLQVQEANRNTGATDRGVAPQEAGALRINALKALSIAQQADIANAALTGSQIRLNEAKNKAQQIIDLKYAPLEAQIEIKKRQYELNKDILMGIDAKRTEALNAKIKAEEREIADQKAKEKAAEDEKLRLLIKREQDKQDAVNLSLKLQQNGAPAELIRRASQANSMEEIQNLPNVGEYLTSPAEKLDIRFKQAQIAKAYSDISSARSAGSQAVSGGVVVKVEDMDKDPDFRKIKGSSELKRALESYKLVVDEYGGAKKGTKQGAILDARYQEALQAYRAAKDLGALQGADISLVEAAIKPATFEGSRLLNPITALKSGRVAKESIEEALTIANKNIADGSNLLSKKRPEWQETDYFKAIVGGSTSSLEVDENGNIIIPDGAVSDGTFWGQGN